MGLISKEKRDLSRELVSTILGYVNSLPVERQRKFNGIGVLCEYARCVLAEIKGVQNYCYPAEFKLDIDNCVKVIRNKYNLEGMNPRNLELYCNRALDIIHYTTENVKEEIYHISANR